MRVKYTLTIEVSNSRWLCQDFRTVIKYVLVWWFE